LKNTFCPVVAVFFLDRKGRLADIELSLWGSKTVMGSNPVNRSRTLAKIMLLFFAVLFTAVLIHPDVDLLDVHDVKITNARSQFRSLEGPLVQQAPILFARLQLSRRAIVERLLFADEAAVSRDPGASSILRV
jgi:hypothetical protein